jgi:hypothetical protein
MLRLHPLIIRRAKPQSVPRGPFLAIIVAQSFVAIISCAVATIGVPDRSAVDDRRARWQIVRSSRIITLNRFGSIVGRAI